MKLLPLYLLLFSLTMVGQTPDYTLLPGKWQLESMTRNEGAIVFYDAVLDQKEGYPPVFWTFSNDTMHISGDLSVAATDSAADDIVESHNYRINVDTLALNQLFTKGLELATVTNSTSAKYLVFKINTVELVLILYDKYPNGSFRPIDKYSRRYTFRRVPQ